MAERAHIGLIGLAVMGENLALNIASHGYRICVYNRTTSKMTDFVNGRGKLENVIGAETLEALVNCLQKPRTILIMVQAGTPVDATIANLLPLLDADDTIIDGGNSLFLDSNRRFDELQLRKIHFIGAGISGGEEGALKGPSIMPGGSVDGWNQIQHLLRDISAKAEDGEPCCNWIGKGGSGHFVKMVHNGIEYGDMQLLAEGYFILKTLAGMDNVQMSNVFNEWNKGPMCSYLVEITRDILVKKDEDYDNYVIDSIVDAAGQKGTGKWTVIHALDLGIPVTLIGEAVFARCLSSQKAERVNAALEFPISQQPSLSKSEIEDLIGDLHDALYASKIISYAQGFAMLREANDKFNWQLNFGNIAALWRGGCIIRSKFLGNIRQAFDKNPELPNLVMDPFFKDTLQGLQARWRKVVASAALHGIPIPAISSALSYFDGYRTATGSANLIQAQRDYFGAHTYFRTDRDGAKPFHCNWTGVGGTTTSTGYTL